MKNNHGKKKFKCLKCDKEFNRQDNLTRHGKNCKRKEQPSGSGIPQPKRQRLMHLISQLQRSRLPLKTLLLHGS